MAWHGIDVARLDIINTMPATGISMYWVSIVLVVSGCAMILEGVIKILNRFYPLEAERSTEGAS
jgi:TRAP-type C4-dicarboxylate transport system permease small subunit